METLSNLLDLKYKINRMVEKLEEKRIILPDTNYHKQREENIKSKIVEEFHEVLHEIFMGNVNRTAEELIDLMQVCKTYLIYLDEKRKIDLKEINKKHIEKLKKRGVIL